jgi:hypothetical protein
MTTAKEHLDWCVERAMKHANRGDIARAWATFRSDVQEHEGTAHIQRHEFFAMAMLSGLFDTPAEFRRFISRWEVDGGPPPQTPDAAQDRGWNSPRPA